MNKNTAKKLALTIKNEDILEMFQNAKNHIIDWTAPSDFIPKMSWGTVWNVYAAHFDINKVYPRLWYQNALQCFGKWLIIKPYMQKYISTIKKKDDIKVLHINPNFVNYKK